MSSQSPDQRRKRRRSPSNSAHLGAGPSGTRSDDEAQQMSDVATPSALAASTPGRMSDIRSSPPPSSLPPSSPPATFSDITGADDEDGDDHDDDGRILDDERDARRLGHTYGDDDAEDDDDDEGEDLYGDTMAADYSVNPELDTYDGALGINDDESITAMDETSRRLAELKMARRDRAEGKGRMTQRSRAPAFMEFDDDQLLDDGDSDIMGRRRRRRHYDERPEDQDDDAEEEDMPLDQLADIKTDTIAEWIAQPRVRKTISDEFRNFLVTYIDDNGVSVYGQRVKALGELNSESLEVSFLHLVDAKALLAYFLVQCPTPMLDIFDAEAFKVTELFYPNYDRIHSEIHVRIADLPTRYSLRDLRQENLNQLVRVQGVVTRRGGVFPQLKYVKFDCTSCGNIMGPYHQDASGEVKVSFCNQCQKRGPFKINTEQTVYRNFQRLTLQESPGSVPPGRLPRHREVIMLWDLIDSARPGEEVEITGVYRNNFDASLNTKNGFPVFATVLEANHVAKRDDAFAAFRMTEEDEKAIRALARDPNIGKRICKSIAPSIYGHDDIKTAIALSLFGGVPKDVGGKHRLRGDINILLLGDPGTAKSQFLKYVEKTASRAVFTTGQGASAVGLTASVRKDPMTREWTLEGGALVLADKGVCLIDEFDKMNDADRTSIHEAMEQQSISISKAGIVTTLQARCAIVAAANPIRGRYNPTIPFSQNVELTEPILSRFDILCVVKDNVDPVLDDMLARFVVGSHTRSHPRFDAAGGEELRVGTLLDADIIPQDLLRKYIMYARTHIKPKLHGLDQEKLSLLYADLRRESLSTGSYPITVRHLESMIRMAEASAKMHLRDVVRADDIDLAIRATIESFVSAQKMSVKRTLERGFRKYITRDRDQFELLAFILGGIIKDRMRFANLNARRRREAQHRLLDEDEEALRQQGNDGARLDDGLAGQDAISVPLSELELRAKAVGVLDVVPFLHCRLFRTNGYVFDEQARTVTKTFGRRLAGAHEEL